MTGTCFYRQSTRIVHFDLDTFFVSVERLLDPKLKARPVIVGGEPTGRGVVAGCSYEARKYGVHSAMPIRTAYRLCPEAAYIRGHYLAYAEYSRLVTQIMGDLAPVVEKSSVDEFYVDLSHCERLKGDTYNWAKSIRREVSGETQLPLSFGLATNKLVAKVATTQRAKKDCDQRSYRVGAGDEAPFLAPFPIRALPGIGPVREGELLEIGMRHIGDIAKTPIQVLERQYGKEGRSLSQHSKGIDYSPVLPFHEQQRYSREQTFGEDTLEVEKILATLLSLSSRLAQDLRDAHVLTEKVTLKLRYTDFQTVTKTVSVSATNGDQSIYHAALKLFKQLWTRRVRVRLLGVEASHLLDDLRSGYLFEEDEARMSAIYITLDELHRKYGSKVIRYAGTVISTIQPKNDYGIHEDGRLRRDGAAGARPTAALVHAGH